MTWPLRRVVLLPRLPVLLLLLLLSLGQLAGPNDLGLDARRFVGKEALWDEHADRFLIRSVLGILPGRDELSEPRRALEEKNKEERPKPGPTVQSLGCIAAPLIKKEPNRLLGSKVGVSAVPPEPGCDESAIQVSLLEAPRNLFTLLILLLSSLVAWRSRLVSSKFSLQNRSPSYPIAVGLQSAQLESAPVRWPSRRYQRCSSWAQSSTPAG